MHTFRALMVKVYDCVCFQSNVGTFSTYQPVTVQYYNSSALHTYMSNGVCMYVRFYSLSLGFKYMYVYMHVCIVLS